MSEIVSVVIPTYNRVGFIQQSIDSVFSQTYKNIEIIVVDDGSKDGTVDYIKECFRRYAHWDKSRFKILRFPENRGIPSALNLGYRYCSGKFICQLSSDDKWVSDKIEKQMLLFSRDHLESIGLVYTDYIFRELDSSNKIVKEWNCDCYRWESRKDLFNRLFTDCCMNACTFLMRKKFFMELGEYSLDKNYEWNQDLHFNFKAALLDHWDIVHMRNYYSAIITIHENQASKQGKCGLGNDFLLPEMRSYGRRRNWIL